MAVLCVGRVSNIVGADGATGSPLPGIGQYQLVFVYVGFPSGVASFTGVSRIVANAGDSKCAIKAAAKTQIQADATTLGLTFGSGDTVQILGL